MALPLLRPSHGDDARRRYTYCIVPLWTSVGLLFIGPFCGFNVWLMDVLDVFGYHEVWSPAGAAVTTAFNVAILSLGVSSTLIGPRLQRIGVRPLYFLGTVGSCCAMLASGAALECRSLVGLYLAWGLLYGLSQGAVYLVVITCCMSWFGKCGKAGYGAGCIGFNCGLWAAVFSYVGPAAVDAVGLARSFQLCGVVLCVAAVWPAFFICTADEIACAAPQRTSGEDIEEASGGKPGGRGEGAAEAASAASPPLAAPANPVPATCAPKTQDSEPMTMRQVLLRPEVWGLWFKLLFAMWPGYGVKYVISPMMANVFAASGTLQATASFIFLVGYAVARLVSGLVAGPFVSARRFTGGLVVAMGIACVATGAFLFSVPRGGRVDAHGDTFACVFVALIACLGMALAGLKVMIPLLVLDIAGPANLPLLMGLMLSANGVAAVLGPVTSWMALAANGDGNNPSAVGTWFCCSACLTAVAMTLHVAKPPPCCAPK